MRTGRHAAYLVAVVSIVLAAGCGSGAPFDGEPAAIEFETVVVAPADAGRLYNQVIRFNARGGAALPDRFEVDQGILPPGVTLMRDRMDENGDGLPDETAPFTGHARLLGLPRTQGTFTFVIKAISTGTLAGAGQQPDLARAQPFEVSVGEGAIAILTPTAEEGTVDPTVPAFPELVNFVNPADPQAFFSFGFLMAGGSGNNRNNVYVPRELELSLFDQSVVEGLETVAVDTSEGGDKFLSDVSDGGWFVQAAGNTNIQVGGFQSPRGPVGIITMHAGGAGLDPDWFQRTPGQGGPPINSRRDFGDTLGLAGGDATLDTPLPVQFSDYFDDRYEGTDDEFTDPPGGPVLTRRKYPFTADQYANAFFVPATTITALRYRAIVEAIDTRGTPSKLDDQIARKSYLIQVFIPDILIDTVVLPSGQAGVDYNEFVNASGGVPPLSFELEWVDATTDLTATDGDPLDQETLGLEVDQTTGQFFGLPRAAGVAELTIRVFAQVLNPTQGSTGFEATLNPGEFVGTHPLTGRAGIHRTFPMTIAPPTAPSLTNTALASGIDGQSYNAGQGDTLVGAGGVPNLVPPPVGFVGTYPSSAVARTYTWTASYIRDTSYDEDAGTPDPDRALPRDLVLDGDAFSSTSGRISGIAHDRGFHPVSVSQTDFFVGPTTAPDVAANAQSAGTTVPLSISPDTAVYMRGAGGPGLLDSTAQQAEARMVPMFQSAGLFTVRTGTGAQPYAAIPASADILPVMLVHGGSDAHNNKGIPSISGFWPAESNREQNWDIVGNTRAWNHLQQQFVWIQPPSTTRRVFLWGETEVKRFDEGATSGGLSKRYQSYDTDGERGVLIVDPLSGDFWVPAVLENGNPSHGSQFGGECVIEDDTFAAATIGYWKNQNHGDLDSRMDRDVHTQGLGSYIEAHDTVNNGWRRTSQGRTATSVAMSADGLWCATALPGGSDQKILLWRTDKGEVTLSGDHVDLLFGFDAAGVEMETATAAILSLGDQDFSGTILTSDQATLLPDSLMFVDGGLVFLSRRNLDRVFGVRLSDGALSSRDINDRLEFAGEDEEDGTGFGPDAAPDAGMYVPDQDYLRGGVASLSFSTQFAFAGNRPAPGATGPTRLAFVAGEFRRVDDMPDNTPAPRDGYIVNGNRNKSLLYLELDSEDDFDLSLASVRDLSGGDDRIFGDYLTPGRHGEEQDYLVMSDDGTLVAVVRDALRGPIEDDEFAESTFSVIQAPTFAQTNSGTAPNTFTATSTDDLLVMSTQGDDLDTTKNGAQHVLFFGTGAATISGGNASVPAYASSRNLINARGRRVNGLMFTPDSNTLIFNYSGSNGNSPKFNGQTQGWSVNANGSFAGGEQVSYRLTIRDSEGDALGINAMTARNNLQGLAGITTIGPTGSSIGDTTQSDQLFWATFRSADGRFLYYVSDQTNGRNHMVGINVTASTINGRAPFTPFSPHAATVGFEQFDVNSFNYEGRFAAVPGGHRSLLTGRDADGILFVIASDASAGAQDATDLEVYAFDANIGGNFVNLTSGITDGSENAINHLYVSLDGNVLVGQRTRTSANSRDSRAALNANNDIFVVSNVHGALTGATPNAFLLSEGQSHGATVAFIGEGTELGPQALLYSSAPPGGNATWDERQLRVRVLAPGAAETILDSSPSYYAILSGVRRIDDNPADPN